MFTLKKVYLPQQLGDGSSSMPAIVAVDSMSITINIPSSLLDSATMHCPTSELFLSSSIASLSYWVV